MEPKSRKNNVDEKEGSGSAESSEDEHYHRRRRGLWAFGNPVVHWLLLCYVMSSVTTEQVIQDFTDSACPVSSLLPSGSPAKSPSALVSARSLFVACLYSEMRSSLLPGTKARACWRVCFVLLRRSHINIKMTDSRTVANHISTWVVDWLSLSPTPTHSSSLDDPLAWGSLPAHYYFHSRMTRWALGASDIMFTNPWAFLQVLSDGLLTIHPCQIDSFPPSFGWGRLSRPCEGKASTNLLWTLQSINSTRVVGWVARGSLYHIIIIITLSQVHLYAEGKVNQPDAYPTDEDGVAHLPRFKWGVYVVLVQSATWHIYSSDYRGRMVMESTVPPVIIPMWLTGFDRLMPQGRAFPYNYLPRPGAELSVTFGNPIPPDSIRQGLLPPSTMDAVREVHSSTVEQLPKIRSRVTSVIHDAVEDLGRSVSGKLLYPPRQGWIRVPSIMLGQIMYKNGRQQEQLHENSFSNDFRQPKH